jgi:hypothetical protein
LLNPTNARNRIDKTFSVADIENRTDGTVLAVGHFDGERYQKFENWDSWLSYCFSSEDKRDHYVYAHNGSGWDWLSLIEHICKNGLDYTFDSIQNGSKLVCVMLSNGKTTIKLLDSLFILQSSLDKAAKLFTGKGKANLEYLPEWYYYNDRATFNYYLKTDCMVLHETMTAFCDTVFSKIAPIGRLGITLPSTAMKVFTTKYLSDVLHIPSHEGLRKALRLGYCGGRVEVFKPGYFPKVNVYDVNSLYPSVMADTPVPINARFRETTKPDLDGCGIFYVKYKQKKGVPLLLHNGLGSYTGEGWYILTSCVDSRM